MAKGCLMVMADPSDLGHGKNSLNTGIAKRGAGQTKELRDLISYKMHTMCPKYNFTSEVSNKVSPRGGLPSVVSHKSNLGNQEIRQLEL